jgi:hypothetical protein
MPWGDGSGVPTSGKNLVIVGTDNNSLLHIRIFDANGNRVTDTDETKLSSTQVAAISTLKQRLPGLQSHVLSGDEKTQVITEVTSIVGQARIRNFWPIDFRFIVLLTVGIVGLGVLVGTLRMTLSWRLRNYYEGEVGLPPSSRLILELVEEGDRPFASHKYREAVDKFHWAGRVLDRLNGFEKGYPASDSAVLQRYHNLAVVIETKAGCGN